MSTIKTIKTSHFNPLALDQGICHFLQQVLSANARSCNFSFTPAGVVLALLIFWCIEIFTSPENVDYPYCEIAEKITKNRLFSARSNSLFFGSMYVTAITFVKFSNRNKWQLKVTFESP